MCRDFSEKFEVALASGSEQEVQRLLGIAASPGGFDIVAKFTIHYSYLGDAKNFDFLYSLILGLEELEAKRPSVSNESVVQRLMGPLGGKKTKERMNGMKLRGKDTAEHDFRALVAESLLLDIAQKRPVKVAKHLMNAMNDPILWGVANEIFDHVLEITPWKLSYNDLSEIRRAFVISLKDEETRSAARRVLEKLIEQGCFSMVYLIAPLLAATRDPSVREDCSHLLDKVLEHEIREPSEKSVTMLVKTVTAAFLNRDNTGFCVRISEKMIDEGHIPLIHMVAPLLYVASKNYCRPVAMPLISRLKKKLDEGAELGSCSDELLVKTKNNLVAASHNPAQSAVAEFFIRQMKGEGTWSFKDTSGKGFKRPGDLPSPIRKRLLSPTY
jgi:hypothetical protein